MDKEDTIPSQLGPANTIPAPLGSGPKGSPHGDGGTGAGGLIVRLLLLALTVGMGLYFAR